MIGDNVIKVTDKTIANQLLKNAAKLLGGKLTHWNIYEQSGELSNKIVIEYKENT
jgi:hypothetical protein|tara:strand:- start:1126 stop:1290 length:165 start_codon:yes stop_codon:yes gene_type:complete